MKQDKPSARSEKAAYHHGDLSNTIKNVALGLIAAKGVEGFSLREAAKIAGVSPSAVYRHYADKGALFSKIAEDGLAQLANEFQAAMNRVESVKKLNPQERARARLAAQGEAYVGFALANPSLFLTMFGPHGALSAQPARPPKPGSPFEMLGHALDELQASGEMSARLRPNAEIPVWSAVHGLASLLVAGALNPLEAQRMIKQTTDHILRSLTGKVL